MSRSQAGIRPRRARLAVVVTLAALTGCSSTEPSTAAAGDAGTPRAGAAPASAAPVAEVAPAANKIAAPLKDVIEKLRTAGVVAGKPSARAAALYATPLVKVDDRARVHCYVHVTSWGGEERQELEAAGAKIEAANDRMKMVQLWIPYDRVETIAALPFVKRVTPPSYATGR